MTPTFSIVTPTYGRTTLRRMLETTVPQLLPGDEILVIGDGPCPDARRILYELGISSWAKYLEIPERTYNYGNPQRNAAVEVAAGTHLVYVDDDDELEPGALVLLREVLPQQPDRPHMFRMRSPLGLLWRERAVRHGNVSGQMFVVPRRSGRIGLWSGRYAADFDFIRSTLALYPDGEAALVWREETIAIQGFAGPHGAGGREIL